MSDQRSDTRTVAPLVFITGASSGIGQALAARYARAGWRLALVARRRATLQDWVDEFERAQLLVRLSPKLRQRHAD